MILLWTIVIAGISIAHTTTATYDPDVSNGTCYYKKGKEADEAYAPAGNGALGHVFCCQLGDKLNEQNSCTSVLEGGSGQCG